MADRHSVRYGDAARMRLSGLSRTLQARILGGVGALAQDPYRHRLDVKKIRSRSGKYRLRVGSYRVVYRIDGSAPVIEVIGVVSRNEDTY